ncbi:MAG TPA: VWA domain-containing protein, partial [Vicinamibacteria bacterium]|nr:VWA domain-containing protein [Vicinamibacteria bacterium]
MQRPLTLVPLALFLLAPAARPAPQAQAPEQTPVFPREVELVTVDAVVTDKAGNPVAGLTRDDFTVTEEGAPQTIQTFEMITAPPVEPEKRPGASVDTAAAPERPRIATNFGPRPPVGRTFIVVFDNMNLTPLNAQRAKRTALAFLDRGLRPGDRVMLAATGGGAWWTTRMPEGRADLLELLKGLDARHFPEGSAYDRMTDFEAMRIYNYSDAQVARRVQDRWERYGVQARNESDQERAGKDMVIPGRIDLVVDNKAAQTYLKVRSRNRTTFAALERLLKPLVGSKDRKSLLFVSEGFVYDPAEVGYRKVVEAARRANTAVYFVDTRGLTGSGVSFYNAEFGAALDENNVLSAIADTTQDAEGAVSMARDTGGFSITSTNDLENGILRIGHESTTYYLLGYNPGNVPRDGRFRRIEVKVRRPGVSVRARRGYFAPTDAALPETEAKNDHTDPQIQLGLDSPTDADAIPLRLTAYVLEDVSDTKARVLLASDADVSRVQVHEENGRRLGSLDTLAVVARRENAEFFRNDQKVDLEIKAGGAGPSWYTMVREFELPAGGYQAKMVVRDPAGSRLGTVTLLFEVPPLDHLRLTTPVLSDTVQAAPNAPPVVALLARRTFRNDRPLFCRFDVLGARKDGKGMPRVTAGHLLRRADGTVVSQSAPTEIAPTSIGAIVRLMQIPLSDLAPGDYELVLTARDEQA